MKLYSLLAHAMHCSPLPLQVVNIRLLGGHVGECLGLEVTDQVTSVFGNEFLKIGGVEIGRGPHICRFC